MRWRRRPRSGQLEDRRGGTGGRIGLPGGIGKAGLPVVLLAVIGFVLSQVLGGGGGFEVPSFEAFPRVPAGGGEPIPRETDPQADLVDFVSFVLDDVQGMWDREFERSGERYAPAELILFTEATDSGCGVASSEVGPFYCPADRTAYLDLGFFEELRRRFGAPGDFAQAYVLAHEIAHHVQLLLGISEEVGRLSRQSPDQANELSIRQELQADCLAGVWGFTANERGILEPGDLQEGLDAAAAIGDDRIQKQSTGRTNPETWTHGSSEQRTEWFSRGFDSGDPEACDTFSGDV